MNLIQNQEPFTYYCGITWLQSASLICLSLIWGWCIPPPKPNNIKFRICRFGGSGPFIRSLILWRIFFEATCLGRFYRFWNGKSILRKLWWHWLFTRFRTWPGILRTGARIRFIPTTWPGILRTGARIRFVPTTWPGILITGARIRFVPTTWPAILRTGARIRFIPITWPGILRTGARIRSVLNTWPGIHRTCTRIRFVPNFWSFKPIFVLSSLLSDLVPGYVHSDTFFSDSLQTLILSYCLLYFGCQAIVLFSNQTCYFPCNRNSVFIQRPIYNCKLKYNKIDEAAWI
jgi:hypothetical protein